MRVRAKLNKADAEADADGQTEEVNKLSDITVEEVSIVDRPANRRTFLVVKSARGAEPAAKTAEKPAPMKISANEKAKLTQKVQAAVTAVDAMQAALATAEEVEGAPMPDDLQNAMAMVSKLFSTEAPKQEPLGDDVLKAGRKFSAANEAKLRDAVKLISELLGDAPKDDDDVVVPETAATAKADKAAEPKADPPKVEKGESSEAIASLTDVVTTLVTAVKAQKARLDELAASTPGSRQVSKAGEDDEPEPSGEPEFYWPMDLNRPHTRANTPVEKSFFDL